MPRTTGHTHFAKGKHLRVKLKNGYTFFDHFIAREGRFVVLREAGRIRTRDISVMGFAKRK